MNTFRTDASFFILILENKLTQFAVEKDDGEAFSKNVLHSTLTQSSSQFQFFFFFLFLYYLFNFDHRNRKKYCYMK